MEITQFFMYLLVMAGVTYLIRVVPLVIFQGKVKSRFVKSFLAYVPYAVLGAMTFPAVFFSTHSLFSGIAGTLVGVILAYKRKSLLFVAVAACVTAYLSEMLFAFFC